MQLTGRTYLLRLLAPVIDVCRRFPVPVAVSAATLAAGVSVKIDDPLFHFMAVLQLAVFAAALHVAAHGASWRRFVVAHGLAVLAAAAVFAPGVESVFLLMALALLLFMAPFIGRPASDDDVWNYGVAFALSAFWAKVSAVLVYVCTAIFFATAEYLFSVRVSTGYVNAWLAVTLFVGPVLLLAWLPRPSDRAGAECTAPKQIVFLISYIVVPLGMVYAALLYAYGASIVSGGELPRGRLGMIISIFGAAGVLTHHACYALRDTGTWLVRFFYRRFYAFLLPLLVLLAVALYERIAGYGLTPNRLLVLLGLVWLVALSVIAVWRRPPPLKTAPWLLAVLLLAGAFLAEPVSIISQKMRLAAALSHVGVLQPDGTLTRARADITNADVWRISGLADFFADKTRYRHIKDYLPKTADPDDKRAPHSVIVMCERWGVPYVNRWQRRDDARNPADMQEAQAAFSDKLEFRVEQDDIVVPTLGASYDYYLRHFHADTDGDGHVAGVLRPGVSLTTRLEARPPRLILTAGAGRTVAIDLSDALVQARAAAKDNAPPVILTASANGIAVRVEVLEINAQKENGIDTISRLSGRMYVNLK